MTKLAALALSAVAVAALSGCLAGCSASVSTSRSVDRADLENQLTTMYTPDDPSASIDATCGGDLAAKVDATQDCHLEVGEQTADVRVAVTSVDGSDTKFDVTPFVTADKVAATIEKSLTDQGYQVDSVDCEAELVGEKGRTVDCTAAPADGDGRIVATVSSVKGLLVDFDYEVVS